MKHLSSTRGACKSPLASYYQFALFLCLLLSTGHVFSQSSTTYAFNYSDDGLTTGCNTFHAGTDFFGYATQTVYGTPTYNENQGAISMPVDVAGVNAVGVTEYGIAFPFKAGYSYTIQVYASGTQNASKDNEPGTVALELANSLPAVNSGSSACNGFAQVAASDFTNYRPEAVGVGFAWLTGFYNNYVMPQNYSELLVAALPSTNTEDTNYVYVREIEITETSPISMSPATVSTNCGYPLTQTFTVNNLNGLTGITGYTWNGSANGWEYNGAPAVFPITTTANTITLTQSCTATALGNIVATANVNGAAYATATAAVNFSTALPADAVISGSNVICTNGGTSVFTLQNPPSCGSSSIAWSFSDASIGSISPTTGTSTTLTANNMFLNGTGTLTASVPTACGTPTVTEPINVFILGLVSGTYYSTSNGQTSPTEGLSFLGQNEVVSYGTSGQEVDVFITLTPLPGATFSWNFTSGFTPVPITEYGGPNEIELALGGGHATNTSLSITMTEPCGTFTQNFAFEVSGFNNDDAIKVLPNPVRGSQVAVSIQPGKNQTAEPTPQMIYGVKLTDLSGRILQSVDYKAGISTANIQFPGVEPGSYFLSVFDGKKWRTKLLLVSK